MKSNPDFASLFDSARETPEFHVERASLEFTEEVIARMEALGISRAELARRLGTSPAYITKLLRGTTNFTLDTMIRIARILGCTLRTHLQPDGTRSQWFDVLESRHASAGLFADCKEMNRMLRFYDRFTTPPHSEPFDDQLPLAS